MRQFVPMTDDLLYRVGGPPGRLVPYRAGLDCWHALGEDGFYRFEEDARFAPPSHAPVEAGGALSLISTALAQPA